MKWISYPGFARGLLGTLIVIAIFLALAYACFCTQAGAVGAVPDGRSVMLVGRVRSAHGDGAEAAVYELEDPSGRIFVTTEVGAPIEGALILVRAKRAERTKDGRLLSKISGRELFSGRAENDERATIPSSIPTIRFRLGRITN